MNRTALALTGLFMIAAGLPMIKASPPAAGPPTATITGTFVASRSWDQDQHADEIFLDTGDDAPISISCPPPYQRFCDTLRIGQRVRAKVAIESQSQGLKSLARVCVLHGIRLEAVTP